MRTLYLECNSGISGDMTVAALLDLGADPQVLRQGLSSLGVEGYRLEISRVSKSGIDACDFDVILGSEEEAQGHGHHHEHSNEHSHNHEHEHSHEHPHHGHEHGHGETHSHGHSHDHGEGHHHHGGHHVHRNVGDIAAIIDGSAITPGAKALAKKIFDVVARAEAKVHGKPVEEVHFHEVGAVDSIVDIVGAAICIDNLAPQRILCSPLREGTGMVRCQHGLMPVPAPATLEIVRERDIPLIITDNQGEMVTPTGAAIVAALTDSFGTPENARVQAVGYGAGKREYKTANVLRAMLLEEADFSPGNVLKMECNLDDITGEELAYACEKLLEAGALDVWCTPILMKKGRPGQLLSVLADPEQEKPLAELLFRHTSTIGIRLSEHRRHILERREKQVETTWGTVLAKESWRDGVCKTKLEFESAKRLAEENNAPLSQIYRDAYTNLDT